jgi:hypothetical protein
MRDLQQHSAFIPVDAYTLEHDQEDASIRVECAWHWETEHPDEQFPEEATSMICPPCEKKYFTR